jgi:RNA polymerase sigma factor, sigma-70 family
MMSREELLDKINNTEFINKIYGFAYKKCYTSHEAEDLCSEIILNLIKAIHKTDIRNFDSFVWTLANRTYADHCDKNVKYYKNISREEFDESVKNLSSEPIEEFIELDEDRRMISRIRREISFLSIIYRDVMIMYYIDEMKVSDIAKKLGISEAAVKQRLFKARNDIKKEVEKMNTNADLTLKPIAMTTWGSGEANAKICMLWENTDRVLSKNLLYLCKDTPKTIKELSAELNTPMPFIENEVWILTNGGDGLLKEVDGGKYISTFLMVDIEAYRECTRLLRQFTDVYADKIETYMETIKDEIESFPFLNGKCDYKFVLWSFIHRMMWNFSGCLSQYIGEKYYPEIKFHETGFYPFGLICSPVEDTSDIQFYGCDGIHGHEIGGYRHVNLTNIYGYRKEPQFRCETNLATAHDIIMMIQSVGGLDINTLSDNGKEIAAKGIAKKLIKKDGDIISPAVVVISSETSGQYFDFANNFASYSDDIIKNFSDEYYKIVNKYLQKHLTDQYNQFIHQTSNSFTHEVIEKCIERGILNTPDDRVCAEGTYVILTK